MKGMSKFYRLIWDWLILIPTIVAAVLFMFPPSGSSAHADRAARVFLWLLTIAFPAAMGLMLASRTASIRSAEWAWTLPSQRKILYVGSWHVLIGTVVFVSGMHAVVHGSPFPAAGIATLSFALPIVLTYENHPILGPVLGMFAFGVLVAAADVYIAVVSQHGLLVGVCCFAVGAILMRRTGSADGYREAIFRNRTFLEGHPARWMVLLGYAPDKDAPFTEVYRKRGHVGWIQSGFLANTSSLWRIFAGLIWNAIYFSSMTSSFNFPVFVATPIMTNREAAMPLSTGILYPMHRKTRAGVAIGMQIIVMGTQILFTAIMLGAAMTIWPEGIDDHPARIYRFADFIPLFAAMMIWLPVVLWSRVRPTFYRGRGSFRRLPMMLSVFLPIAAFALLSVATSRLYMHITQHIAARPVLAAMFAAAIVTHVMLLLVMRHRYYTDDLV